MSRIALFLVFTTFVFAQVSQAQVLATVGRKTITKKFFDKKYSEVKRNVLNPPPPSLFLQDLIKFEVGLQEAKKRKLQNDPIVIDRYNQELYKALVEKSIGSKVQKIKVSEKDMRKHYRNQPEVKTSHILIQFKTNSTAKEIAIAEKRANEIYKEVKSSKRKFPELVKLYSDDFVSKKSQGDIGYQSSLSLAPSYYQAARKLKVGQISKPVRTRFGFHIIKLTGVQKFEKANRRQLRAAVFDEKRKVEFDNFFGKLMKKYKIKMNTKEIKKLKN